MGDNPQYYKFAQNLQVDKKQIRLGEKRISWKMNILKMTYWLSVVIFKHADLLCLLIGYVLMLKMYSPDFRKNTRMMAAALV